MEAPRERLGVRFSGLWDCLVRAAGLSRQCKTPLSQGREGTLQPAFLEGLGLLLAYKSDFYLGLFARAEKKKEGGYSNVEILEENLCAPLCENPSPLMGQTDRRPDLPFDSVEI